MALLLYWKSTDYASVEISMRAIIFVGLAMTLGFHISHLVLGRGLEWRTLLQRRLVGYTIGVIASAALYRIWYETDFKPIDPFLSLPAVFVLFFGLGYIIQNGFLNRLVEGPYLTMLLVTFAMSIALQNIGLQIYAADPRRINVGYSTGREITGGITVAPTRVYMTIVAVIMVIGLVSFLRYTRIGYAIRAAAQNKMAAKLMGINIYEVYAITFGVSLALTGMAGAMMGIVQPITPVDGPEFTLRAFAIVALGGLGKVQGVVVGGMVLGIAESLVGGYVNTGWAITVAFVLLVVMLVVRPQGITGGMVAEEA
jgi:branched-chain amino acid transport system permease protein